MEQILINPLDKEKRRCKHHHTLPALLKDDDSVVAYVLAYKRNNSGNYLLLEAGTCPERVAIAAQEYYAGNERNALGGFVVYFEHPNGDVAATLERIHEGLGAKEEFPRVPLIPRNVLMQYAEHFLLLSFQKGLYVL